ncbi:hypothetical protein, partial [Lactobacillus delbrueckii]|uniref:hypothetical protein n=1 Tax=Lactobacillus delbrueckii TaxID=1584 RepID=UPI001E408B59
TTERTRHFLVKKPKKILQLRLEDKNVFNAIHLNSIGYVFEFGETCSGNQVVDFFNQFRHFKVFMGQVNGDWLQVQPPP